MIVVDSGAWAVSALDAPLVTLDRKLANTCAVIGVEAVVPAA